METMHWHSEFNPAKFLSRVNLTQLLERNEAYNESSNIYDAKSPCILCTGTNSRGILLNDRSFLCQKCYAEVALVSYPEKYEALRRQFVLATESRRLAWEAFRDKYEQKPFDSSLTSLGWASLLLLFVNPAFLFLTGILLLFGHHKNYKSKKKIEDWLMKKEQWEQTNPAPQQPLLRHFHDPSAELTVNDHLILKIFNHWPGYPPFWGYLREVVLKKDNGRCQVSGCPSRLELHIHHIKPVSDGGEHAPNNLVSLCDFHHALEPEKGHERIWAKIKTRYLTLVCGHERSNRETNGSHSVRAHIRRLQLVSLDELKELTKIYGFACPQCENVQIKITLDSVKNLVAVECPACNQSVEGPQQLTEETGPRLAELLCVTRNQGRWKTRWDMLSERASSEWGNWKGSRITKIRKEYKDRLEQDALKPICPFCGSNMRLIRPRPNDSWKPFWGCTQFKVTGCKGSARFFAEKNE
jgi:HNH endonuclease